ncbi:LacI family DNA-binding transcriptional regulator [Actinoplanes sp. NPDC051861]|uniref:LacI family DNA-binding transcriptional regulator n=1 Tax=Actinoplanes sp. NPDC051861 TaxID=3155170 RepID=UPI003416198D
MAMKALTKPRQATIYQVAERAGVSIATVSRALREDTPVTDETRRRVREAAAELQFTPSRSARSLAEGRHAANGIVFPDLVGPYFAEVLLGYEAVAAGLGSSVLILTTRDRRDAADAVRDLARRVDGLAVHGRTVGDDLIAALAGTVPVVLIARDPVPGVDTVRTGNRRTARALAEHLLGHGHHRFAFLGDPDSSPDFAGRYAGLRDGLQAARANAEKQGNAGKRAGRRDDVALHLVPETGFDLEAGERAARSLLTRRNPPQALVCANDELALGALRAAAAAGLDVPGDLAITGWDDLLAARFAGLTTVAQPMRSLGATAARWLDRRIDDPSPAARRRVLPTRLVVRGSCGDHHL